MKIVENHKLSVDLDVFELTYALLYKLQVVFWVGMIF
jgi:hypothetical protein